MFFSAIFWSSSDTVANAIWATLESIGLIGTAYLLFRKSRKTKKDAKLKIETDKDAATAAVVEHESQLQDELDSRNARDAIKKQLEDFDIKYDKQNAEILGALKTINYALFNAGKTGLVNRMDEVWVVLPKLQSDIAVLLDRTRNGQG